MYTKGDGNEENQNGSARGEQNCPAEGVDHSNGVKPSQGQGGSGGNQRRGINREIRPWSAGSGAGTGGQGNFGGDLKQLIRSAEHLREQLDSQIQNWKALLGEVE